MQENTVPDNPNTQLKYINISKLSLKILLTEQLNLTYACGSAFDLITIKMKRFCFDYSLFFR